MAMNFQQQSRFRKLVYAGAIVALLTVSMLHRKFIVEPQAFNLQLRAEAQGEVELTSSAVRLTLLGSRGLATSVLWQMAIEKQKRHQWNELELLVKSITKLQPNFVSPWLFQSWNLAYNVAVECDRTRDKYFYISRGVQLLAEGERRHRGYTKTGGKAEEVEFPGNPNMRFYMGMFYQMKIGNSDEKYAMRCLFDLSCIDPLQWEPTQFRTRDSAGRPIVKLKQFETFCRLHPRLVRRLRERLRCTEPEDVLVFLKKNQGIPSRFDEAALESGQSVAKTPLIEPHFQQFPTLPPPVTLSMPDPAEREFNKEFDVFVASNAWYQYAQQPLPPLPDEPRMGVNEPNPNSVEFKLKYRLPKMMTEIFRNYPARALEYVAEERSDEGWFDEDGWLIDRWFPDDIRVGRETKYHSSVAWSEAYLAYQTYGRRLGLLLSKAKKRELEKLADYYRKKTKYDAAGLRPIIPPRQLAEDPKLAASLEAKAKLDWYQRTRKTTNFNAHYQTCRVERLPEVVAVRKKFFQAKQLKNRFNLEALPRYKEALTDWMEILLKHREFQALVSVQSETYEHQWRYLELYQDDTNNRNRLLLLIEKLMPLAKCMPTMYKYHPATIPFFELNEEQKDELLPLKKVRGPFEFVYRLDVENRPELQHCLLNVGQAFVIPLGMKSAFGPLVPVTETQRLRLLTLYTTTDRKELSSQWLPLLKDVAIAQARLHLRLPTFESESTSEEEEEEEEEP